MKPLFLNAPGHWTRAPRTSQSATDFGYAIEGPARRRPYGALWWTSVVVLCVASAVLIVVGR